MNFVEFRDMIEIAQFTPEQAKNYWQAINQLKLNLIYQNQPVQCGFPVIISAEIADQLYQASQEVEDYNNLACFFCQGKGLSVTISCASQSCQVMRGKRSLHL
jgi:hypothetical protein